MSIPYKNKIFNIISKKIIETNKVQVIFLEGGHYDPRIGVTEFSIYSLKGVIELAERLIKEFGKKVRIVFGILVDDLGLKCGTDICQINSNDDVQELVNPKSLELILDKSKIVKRERVIISSERNAKNRSLLYLKNMLKRENGFLDENCSLELDNESTNKIYYLNDFNQKVLLAKYKGNVWTSQCPSIMAIHYRDIFTHLRQRFFDREYDFTIIDISEVIDRNKVNMGSEVYLRLINEEESQVNKEIINVFFCDKIGSVFFIDRKNENDY